MILLLLLSLFSATPAYADELGCPNSSSPNPAWFACADFEGPIPVHGQNGWELDRFCCWDHGTGKGTAGAQTGVLNLSVVLSPGTFDPGDCNAITGICGQTPGTFTGPQGFQSNNTWWSDRWWVCCGGNYIHKIYTGHDELWARWYEYVSPNWRTNCGTYKAPDGDINTIPCGSKSFSIFETANTMQAYTMIQANGNGAGLGQPHIEAYWNAGIPCADATNFHGGDKYFCSTRLQNQGNNITIAGGKWYLNEWHVKMNTSGVANGISEWWIDEVTPGVPFTIGQQTLRQRATDMVYRSPTGATSLATHSAIESNNNVGHCRPTGLTSDTECIIDQATGLRILVQPNAYRKIDQVVWSTSRIGPMGAINLTPAASGGLGVR